MSIRRPKTNYRDNFFDNTPSNHGWYRCEYCGKPIRRRDADVDHQIAQARGGTNDLENLVAACPHCNRQKGSMDSTDYQIWKEIVEDEEEEHFEACAEKIGWEKAMENEVIKLIRKGKL